MARTRAPKRVAAKRGEGVRQLVVDCHVHLHGQGRTAMENVDFRLRYADRLGIDALIVSLGETTRRQPSADDLVADNNWVRDAVEYCPERIYGLVYASPNHIDETLDAMERHIRNGPMVGLKMWVCRRCNDPAYDPIVEYAAELGVPIQQHTWIKSTGNLATESTPWDMLELAKRHPQAQFLMAHSGGNWEKGIRIVRDQPNIAIDLCGGDPEAGQTEYAVELLGADRVLFGSDATGRSFASQLAKVLGADLTNGQRTLIAGGNAARLFAISAPVAGK